MVASASACRPSSPCVPQDPAARYGSASQGAPRPGELQSRSGPRRRSTRLAPTSRHLAQRRPDRAASLPRNRSSRAPERSPARRRGPLAPAGRGDTAHGRRASSANGAGRRGAAAPTGGLPRALGRTRGARKPAHGPRSTAWPRGGGPEGASAPPPRAAARHERRAPRDARPGSGRGTTCPHRAVRTTQPCTRCPPPALLRA